MKTGDKRRVSDRMCHSHTGAFWLAGLEVEVLEIDEGESWEPIVVKVRAKNSHDKLETTWMNPKDFAQ